MPGRVRWLGVCTAYVAILFGIASCAAPTKPLAPEAARQLHKIALLDVTEPPQYGATNM